MGDIGVRDRIKRMTVGDRVDSDHHLVEVWLKGEVRGKKNRGVDRKCWRGFWDEEGRESFRQKVSRYETEGRELDED